MTIQAIKDQLREIRGREDYSSLGVKIDLRASRESLKSQLAEAQRRIAEQEKEQEGEAKDAEKLSEAVQSLIEKHRAAVDDFLCSDNENLRLVDRGEVPCLWTGWDDLEGAPVANFRSRWERMSIGLSRQLAYIASKAFPQMSIPTGVDAPILEFRHHVGEGGLPIRECLALCELSDALFPGSRPPESRLINASSVIHFVESDLYDHELQDRTDTPKLLKAIRYLDGQENTLKREEDGSVFVELAYLPSIIFQATYKQTTHEDRELVFQAFLSGDEVVAPPPAKFSLMKGDDIMKVTHKAYWTWLSSIVNGSPTDPIQKIEFGIETGTHISPDYNYWLAAVILDYHEKPVPQQVREAILSADWLPPRLSRLVSLDPKIGV